MYYAYSSSCLPKGQNLPRTNSLSGCVLLNEAGMLFLLAFLKVSICALRRSTISKGGSWYILKLVSRNRGPKASMLWQSLNLRNLAITGRGLPSFLSFLLLSFLPFLPSSFQGGGLVGFRLPRQHQHPQDPFRGRNVALIRLFSAPVVLWNVSNFKFSRLE